MNICPQCSAAMEMTTIGSMHDKVYRCGYCQFTRDIPDRYEETEERRSEDGRSYVRKTVIRSDLGGEAGAHGASGTGGRRTVEAHIETQVTVHDELLRRVLDGLPGTLQGAQVRVVKNVPPEVTERPEVTDVDPGVDLKEKAAKARKTALWWGGAGAVLVALNFGSGALVGYGLCVGLLWWLVRGSRDR